MEGFPEVTKKPHWVSAGGQSCHLEHQVQKLLGGKALAGDASDIYV